MLNKININYAIAVAFKGREKRLKSFSSTKEVHEFMENTIIKKNRKAGYVGFATTEYSTYILCWTSEYRKHAA